MPWPQSGRTQYEETNKQTIQNENTKTQTQYLRLKNVVLSPAAKETTFFQGKPEGKNPFSRFVFCVLRARLAAGKGLGQTTGRQDEYSILLSSTWPVRFDTELFATIQKRMDLNDVSTTTYLFPRLLSTKGKANAVPRPRAKRIAMPHAPQLFLS
jgi:hypothetical protein